MIDEHPAPERFNLREHVRAVASVSPDPRPAVIASRVLEGLNEAQRHDALLLTLPDYVRNVVSMTATNSRKAPGEERTTSTRADQLRWHNQLLSGRTFNGEDWKFFRDFTTIDLHGAALERYKKAAANQAEGDKFEALALFMEKNDYATVADIPATELRDILGGKA